MRKLIKNSIAILSLTMNLLAAPVAYASDHDDGEHGLKGRELNLTDLYVFREDWQDSAGSAENLVFVMNINPRSVARQQYFFSPSANYDFHVSRVANKTSSPTGADNEIIRFQFGIPDAQGRQAITLLWFTDGALRAKVSMGMTTTLADGNALRINSANVAGWPVQLFAGLREDPFFFDVEQYFKVRASIAAGNYNTGFRSASTAVDFAAGYNVNSIVLKIPRRALQARAETTFDVWETIVVPQFIEIIPDAFNSYLYNIAQYLFGPYYNPGKQIERLGRPAINEGLVLTNDKLNAFNSIPPSFDGSDYAAPIRGEIVTSLTAVRAFGAAVGATPPTIANVAAGFLPDVMRIDTLNTVKVGQWAYNSAVAIVSGTSAPMLVGGRKLEDDVMDITLSYLVAGNPACGPVAGTNTYNPCAVTDNVAYAGNTGNAANPPHKLLNGQTTRNGSAKFPYLAQPN